MTGPIIVLCILFALLPIAILLGGWRAAMPPFLTCMLSVGGIAAANATLEPSAWLPIGILLAAGSLFGKTPLGLLNFVVLQWLGVRLQAAFETADLPRRNGEIVVEHGRWWSRYAPRGVAITWSLQRWIWPLTGWWGEYRWIGGRR